MIDVLQLARELIRIPSVTESEADISNFLYDKLTALGFSAERHEVSSGRFNVFARAGGRPRVVLCTHTDTVPPFFPLYEDAEHLYGRGACDTKGILAAMLAAAERLSNDGARDFAVLLVVGEEADSAGAKAANRLLAELGSEFVVVGEPTESKFARASKGAFTCVVHFDGVAAHSAYPERGDSAIVKMANAIGEIYATDWGSDDVLGKGTVNVGVVRGGVKPNIIAGEAEIEMMFRIVSHPSVVEERLREILARWSGRIIRSQGNPPMHMVAPNGRASTVVAFNTDIPYLTNLGQPVLFGPGSILDAHGAHEKISKREMAEAVTVYYELVRELLAGRHGQA